MKGTNSSQPRRLWINYALLAGLIGTVAATPSAWAFSVAEDTQPPVISDVQVSSISSERALISWRTDELSESRVEYGTEGQPSQLRGSIRFSKQHFITLSGLTPSASITVQLIARDPAGNASSASVVSFTTSAEQDIVPPNLVGDVTVTDLTDTSATLNWSTDEISTGSIRYGLLASALDYQASANQLASDHSVALDSLLPGTEYFAQLEARDISGNVAIAQLLSFQTSGTAQDSDGDGLPDSYEVIHRLDPNDPSDAAADRDSDGLSNLEDFSAGTEIDNPDSDSDGFGDGAEVAFGSDPLDSGSVITDQACSAQDSAFYGYAAAGIDTDEEIAASIWRRLTGVNNQLHSFNVPEGQHAYLAYPVDMGPVTLLDPAIALAGGWDGASWPEGAGWSANTGPLVVERRVDGQPQEWYLYRTDYPLSGFVQLDIRFENAGLEQVCDSGGSNCYSLAAPVYGFAAEGIDTEQEIIDQLTGTFANSQDQLGVQWRIPENSYGYVAYPSALGAATFQMATRVGWDGASWAGDDWEPGQGPIIVSRTVNEQTADWYLYRTDFPVGGTLENVVHFAGLGAGEICGADLTDTDGDGLLDRDDLDDDNDGMPDLWEQAYGLDSLNAGDAGLDLDGDGLTNLEEYRAGTRADQIDTDGDGAQDREELDAGSDPIDKDSLPGWMMPSKGGWRYLLPSR